MNEQPLLSSLLVELIKERRHYRAWNIGFKLVALAITLTILYNLFGSSYIDAKLHNQAHTAMIDINGAIMSGTEAEAERVNESLRNAFTDKGTKGIVLRINSPGGSPVQSSYIYQEINRLKSAHPGIKVYAVCADICASGAYYVASAADKIYADQASLVGSIGVVMDGFGFVGSIEKLGASRRLFTAGAHKGFLDPFSPLKPDETLWVKALLSNIHAQFIESVKKGRGTRLQITQDTFSGLIWTGAQAKEIGLIDDFGSADYVAREIIKEEKVIDYTLRANYFTRLAGSIGASAGNHLVKNLGLEQTFAVK